MTHRAAIPDTGQTEAQARQEIAAAMAATASRNPNPPPATFKLVRTYAVRGKRIWRATWGDQ